MSAIDDELMRRIQADLEDGYDEELELEFEDRQTDPRPEAAATQREARRRYFRELFRLQRELVKLQDWVQHSGHKVVILFEGRDAAGKGGVIKRITQRLNPRVARVVALPAPNDRERTQWYFQRYARPPAGGRRDGAVRPQLVQPRRRRARDGLLQRRAVRGVLPLGARVRAHAGALAASSSSSTGSRSPTRSSTCASWAASTTR